MTTGAPNGVSRRDQYDRWFRYPAGFSPSTLDAALRLVGGGHNQTVVDPFCGCGTVGTATAAAGGEFVGIEAHPLVVQLARLKLKAPPDSPAGLREAAKRVGAAPSLPSDDEAELVRRCFESATLEDLCGMRRSVEAEPQWKDHLTWALLGTLRDVSSKKVGWPYQRPGQPRTPIAKDARARFIARAAAMADDLEAHPLLGEGRALLGDSRTSTAWKSVCKTRMPNACVTSPPYLNNFDYADATRLEVYFLGQASTWRELCLRIRAKMLVASTQQTRVAVAARDLKRLNAAYPKAGTLISSYVDQLREERHRRPRGKEYDQLVPSYFWGIARVLRQLQLHTQKGAQCAWVIGDSAPYGIYIDTPKVTELLASDLGFQLHGSTVLRRRGTRWRQNGTRHEVSLNERLVHFESCEASDSSSESRQKDIGKL